MTDYREHYVSLTTEDIQAGSVFISYAVAEFVGTGPNDWCTDDVWVDLGEGLELVEGRLAGIIVRSVAPDRIERAFEEVCRSDAVWGDKSDEA